MHQLLHLGKLPIGDHAQDHLGICAEIAAPTIQIGHTAIHLMQDGISDLSCLRADDLHLCSCLTHKQHAIQHQGVDQHQKNTVKHVFHRAEHHLQQQNQEVKGIQAGGHRDAEPTIQHQRRNIHAARGCATANHDTQRHTDAEA